MASKRFCVLATALGQNLPPTASYAYHSLSCIPKASRPIKGLAPLTPSCRSLHKRQPSRCHSCASSSPVRLSPGGRGRFGVSQTGWGGLRLSPGRREAGGAWGNAEGSPGW